MAFLLSSNIVLGNNGIYITPDSGTHQVGETVTLQSAHGSGQGVEGEPCCGDSGSGTYEFYDIFNHDWSGAVMKPGQVGDRNQLNTASAGSISVTCNAEMTFRCTGNGEVTSPPTPVSGSAGFTVEGNGTQGRAPIIDPAEEQFVLPHDSEKLTLSLSDEGESATPTDEAGWTLTPNTKKFVWSYSTLIGNPGSGTEGTTTTLDLDRDQPGETTVTVKRKDEFQHTDGRTGVVGNSPTSAQVKVKVQEPKEVVFDSINADPDNFPYKRRVKFLLKDPKDPVKTGAGSLIVKENVDRDITVSIKFNITDSNYTTIYSTKVIKVKTDSFQLANYELTKPPKGEFDAEGYFKDSCGSNNLSESACTNQFASDYTGDCLPEMEIVKDSVAKQHGVNTWTLRLDPLSGVKAIERGIHNYIFKDRDSTREWGPLKPNQHATFKWWFTDTGGLVTSWELDHFWVRTEKDQPSP